MSIISTGWSATTNLTGMATVFYLDKILYATQEISDEGRMSLTVDEARDLVNTGKAIRTQVPHL